ncbi:MAG: hypothetical protein E7627_01695 [Ruminococcaceae bacterium]|nr:hypothetical protein [Oscillospiraceae bacterium]
MKAIWAKAPLKEMNVQYTFQHTLTPNNDTVIRLAASNLYRIFVGGKFVGYGPARAAHGYSRIDEYSLAEWAGSAVTVSVEVYSAQVNTYYIIEEDPFFAAEIIENGSVIATSEDFTAYRMTERVQNVRRFTFQRAFTEIYHYIDDPRGFYAGNVGDRVPVETVEVQMNKTLPRGVHYPKLNTILGDQIESGHLTEDKKDKKLVFESSDADGVDIRGFLPGEIDEDSADEVTNLKYSADPCMKTGIMGEMEYRIFDFGRTLTGFFSFKITAKADTTLYITFDELANKRDGYTEINPLPNNCVNVLKYTLKAGEYNVISFEANTARFACVSVIEGEADLCDFGMVLYENPDMRDFKYDYHDEELNSIVEAAINTLAQNAVDVLTDCPSRERAGWLCDAFFSSRAEYHFTGDNLVERNFLENYLLCPQLPELPEGMIPMCYPADHKNGTYIPNWSMWYILQIREHVRRTGNRDVADAARDKIYGLVKFFEKYYNEYGLLENLDSWVFIEWSMCNTEHFIKGLNYPTNMIWAYTLEAVDELYGDPALSEKAREMKEAIRRLAWNGTYFEDNAVRDENGKLQMTGHTTETAQYYAFYFGVADVDEYRELFELLLSTFGPRRDAMNVLPDVHRSNVIVGFYLRLELLMRLGYNDQVIDDCRALFGPMARLTGTLWENCTLGASLNHGFASTAAIYIDKCAK